MTVYFVSRHEGAQRWARIVQAQKNGGWPHPIDAFVEHLDVQSLRKGDVVIGTLPLREVAEVRGRGAEFYSLDLDVPPQWRGQELTATHMAACNATLTQYRVTVRETIELHAPRKTRAAKASAPVTVMLVSQELAPQYLGYVQAPTAHVLLAVTGDMTSRGADLQALLKAALQPPEKINRLHLDDSQGYAGLLQQAEALLDKLRTDGAGHIVLNLTGGTKLMSMAFAQAGQAAQRVGEDVRLMYVDTQHGRIEHVLGPQSRVEAMQALLGVREAVLASGKADAGCASASALFRRQMQRTPLHDALLAGKATFIGTLNSLAMGMEELATKGKKSKPEKIKLLDVEASKPADGVFVLRVSQDGPHKGLREELQGKLGKLLHQQDVLASRPEQDEQGRLRLRLARRSEIDYLKGGWLEAHVAALLAAAQPDDWACGVQVGEGSGRNNELDALATCGNRTLLVEVKTANLGRHPNAQDDGESSSKGQDTLYKLDSVGHALARNFSANWLVSARPLSKPDLERAKDRRITVFAPQDGQPARAAMQGFTEKLRGWVAECRALAQPAPGHVFSALAVSPDWEKKEKQDAKAAAASEGKQTPPPARGGLSDQSMQKLSTLKARRANKEAI